MKAAKRIRAYLDEMNAAGVLAQKVCGWQNPITRDDLEAVLARLDGIKDLRRQVQKTQTMRTELAAALRHTTPAPFIPRWRDLLAAVRGLHSQSEQHRTDARTANHLLEQEQAERARLASQLAAVEQKLQQEKEAHIRTLQENGRLNAAYDAQRKHDTLRQALREVTEAVLPAYKGWGPGQQLSALQSAVEVEREQNRTFARMLDSTFAAIKNLYSDIGGNNPGILPINDGPGQVQWLQARVREYASEQVAGANAQVRSSLQELEAGIRSVFNQQFPNGTAILEPRQQLEEIRGALGRIRLSGYNAELEKLRDLQTRIRQGYYSYFGYPEDQPAAGMKADNSLAMLQVLITNLLQAADGHRQLDAELAAQKNETASARALAQRQIRRAERAEAGRSELRGRIAGICQQHAGRYPDGNAAEQLDRIQTWLKEAPASSDSPGVQEISTAREYQMTHHPETATGLTERRERREKLQSAALALLTGGYNLYPFGTSSWNGIHRNGGRRAQLAHAGACIAALLDLMPSGVAPLDTEGAVYGDGPELPEYRDMQ
jgi:hypothetical protein